MKTPFQINALGFCMLAGSILSAETVRIDPIIVTAAKTPTSLQETTTPIHIITSEELTAKGYQTVAQALSGVAGISVATNGPTGQTASVFLRGSSGAHILVMVDGIRLNDPSTPSGSAILGTFPVDNIERIEILKGGAGGIWGSRASAGVINIITKSATKGSHATLKVGYGDYATKKVYADFSHDTGSLRLYFQGLLYQTDGFSAKVPFTAEADGYKNKTFTFKTDYRSGQHKLSFFASRNDSTFDYDGFNTELAYGDSTTDLISLRHTYTDEEVRYFSTFKRIKSERNNNDVLDQNTYSYALNSAETNELSFIVRHDTKQGGYMQAGIERRETKGTSTFESQSIYGPYNTISDQSFNVTSAFAGGYFPLNEQTAFEANVRYDGYDKFDNALHYKIGLKHTHTSLEGLQSSINYYASSDTPSTYQLTNTIAGAVLTPSTLKGFDINFNYQNLFLLSFFQTEVTDKIDFDDTLYGYKNFEGTEKFSGIEAQAFFLIGDSTLLQVSYTKLFDIETTNENATPLIRRAKESAIASLEHRSENNALFILEANYTGERNDLDYSTFPYTPVQTGKYTLWNVHYATDIAKNLRFNMHVKNLLDKKYQSVYGYSTAGRNAYFELTYTF